MLWIFVFKKQIKRFVICVIVQKELFGKCVHEIDVSRAESSPRRSVLAPSVDYKVRDWLLTRGEWDGRYNIKKFNMKRKERKWVSYMKFKFDLVIHARRKFWKVLEAFTLNPSDFYSSKIWSKPCLDRFSKLPPQTTACSP